MITSDIYTILTSNSAFTSIAGTRLYPQLLPNNYLVPACTYQVISSVSAPTLGTAGMQKIRIQFDSFATSYSDATNLRTAIVSILNGYQDSNISNATKISQSDYFDHDALLFRCLVEFYVFTTEQ